VESVRVVVQERFKFPAGCKVIPLKLELGAVSKRFLSVPSGTGALQFGGMGKMSRRENNTHIKSYFGR